ncbi:MAG: DUF4374 domain-containing protein, partial [Alistipes sp.]|nr:DUF4374 domain-containing protein [Alistipes sp.]
MKNKFLSSVAIAACALFAACSDTDSEPAPAPNPGGEPASAYVVVGSSNSAAYLLTSESLREGAISAKGDGKEVSAGNSSTWFFFGDKYLYHLSYSQGQAGTTSAYYL